MKWVKLSDREPIPNGNPIIIKIYDGDNILDVFWVTNHIHLVEDWSRYEWLDESDDILPKIKELPRVSMKCNHTTCNMMYDDNGNYLHRYDVLNLFK